MEKDNDQNGIEPKTETSKFQREANRQAINEKGIKMFACSLSQNGDRSNQRLFDHIFTFVVFLSIAVLTKRTHTNVQRWFRASALAKADVCWMVVTLTKHAYYAMQRVQPLHFAYNLYDGYFSLSPSSRSINATTSALFCIEYTLDHCYVVSLFAHLTISPLRKRIE